MQVHQWGFLMSCTTFWWCSLTILQCSVNIQLETLSNKELLYTKAVKSPWWPIRFWLWEANCKQHSTSWQCIRVALFFTRCHDYVYSISLLLCCSALRAKAHDHTCWLDVLFSSMLHIVQKSLYWVGWVATVWYSTPQAALHKPQMRSRVTTQVCLCA